MTLVSFAGFDYDNAGGWTPGEGRRGGGALRHTDGAIQPHVMGYDHSGTIDYPPFYTVDGFALKDKQAGWSADGRLVWLLTNYQALTDRTRNYYGLTTNGAGGLKLWKWFDNVGGTQALLAEFTSVLTAANTWSAYIEIKAQSESDSGSQLIVRSNGVELYNDSTGVLRNDADNSWHILAAEQASPPSGFDLFTDDAYYLHSLHDLDPTHYQEPHDFLGDVPVSTIYPVGVGHDSVWDRHGGTQPSGQPDWSVIDDTYQSSSTGTYMYLNADAPGLAWDTFPMTPLLPNGGLPLFVQGDILWYVYAGAGGDIEMGFYEPAEYSGVAQGPAFTELTTLDTWTSATSGISTYNQPHRVAHGVSIPLTVDALNASEIGLAPPGASSIGSAYRVSQFVVEVLGAAVASPPVALRSRGQVAGA